MKKPLLLSLLCLPLFLHSQQITYVKNDATGTGDGSSWQNAYTTLEAALPGSAYGDQIWVAKGTYFPTSGTDRTSTFLLPVGVSIWGGFSGVESSLSQRDITSNLTTLSGDIGIPELIADNVYHIVTIMGGDSLTIVDGFNLVKANADTIDDEGILPFDQGGGILITTDFFNPIATPVIQNCVFEQNQGHRGTGIACLGDDEYACAPEIRNCRFTRNRAIRHGVAIYKRGINVPNRPFVIENCQFDHNYCYVAGGAISVVNPSGRVIIRDCDFTSDTAYASGGTIFFENRGLKTRYEIENCNFIDNYSYNGHSGISHSNAGVSTFDTLEMIVKKSYFLRNKSSNAQSGALNIFTKGVFNKIQVEECAFESNVSKGGAAAIAIYPSKNTDVSVDRCYFLGNLITGNPNFAGAFYQSGGRRNTLTNSVFMNNRGTIVPIGTSSRVVNCSFYRNGSEPFLKTDVENFGMQILNSVIWEPQAAGVEHVFFNRGSTPPTVNGYLVEHSMIHLSDCNYDGLNPCQDGMIYNAWPEFIDSSGQFGLIPSGSFAGLNKGSNVVADSFGLSKDYLGASRIFCDSVDMGAYEIQGNCVVSGTFEALLNRLPVSITLLQNPVAEGQDIRLECFSAVRTNLRFQLVNIAGTVLRQGRKQLNGAIPQLISIPTANLKPGLYFLQVLDEKGRASVEKIVLM